MAVAIGNVRLLDICVGQYSPSQSCIASNQMGNPHCVLRIDRCLLVSYLKNARTVSNSHLFTAVSIYVLLGMLFFTLYSAFECSSRAPSGTAPRRRPSVQVNCCTSA